MEQKTETASLVTIEEYVYQKVKKADATIAIPNIPVFYQDWNYRQLTGIFPQKSTWKKGQEQEEIWELRIVRINDEGISIGTVRTNPRDLSDIVSKFSGNPKSSSDRLIDSVVRYLKDYFPEDKISQEEFNNRYAKKLADLAEIIYV